MRYFTLHRIDDETGVSGTGVVAWGVKWPDGAVSLRWLGKTPSFVNYEGVPTDLQIQREGDKHTDIVHGHHGKTVIVWMDEQDKKPPSQEEVVSGSRRRWWQFWKHKG